MKVSALGYSVPQTFKATFWNPGIVINASTLERNAKGVGIWVISNGLEVIRAHRDHIDLGHGLRFLSVVCDIVPAMVVLGRITSVLVKTARVKNYHCLRDVTVAFGQQTVLIGGNGTGKSSVLRAIELFYAPSLASVKDGDFFDSQQPIEITLTFYAFTDVEREMFGTRIVDNEMSVTRVIEAGGGKNNGRYFGMKRGHDGFIAVLALDGAQPRRIAFNALVREGPYVDLRKAGNAQELVDAIAEWEQAHPELCKPVKDDGQFFGFTNVANGSLQKATSFVLVPAVRDASIDAVDAKNSAIGQLMELIVRSAVQSRRDIQAFQAEISERYRVLTDPGNLTELGGLATDISGTLQQYYSEVGVSLAWRPADDFSVPLPIADVKLRDDDVEILVDRAGHGVQRAFVMALLQHLARANITAALTQEVIEPDIQEKAQALAPKPLVMPGLILAIEEPELYQHPTKQRHFATVLNALSKGTIPGMATSTQIMFATHSPLFVAMDRFDEVRLFRKVKPSADQRREAVCSTADMAGIVLTIEAAAQKAPGTFSIDSIKPRLHVIGPEVGEGFFAKTVVLVEGISDRAALIAAAAMKKVSFEAEGIAILPVGGKENLDKPWAVFSSLGIPVYAIWDSDKSGKNPESSIRANKLLLRLVAAKNLNEDYPDTITEKYSCFSDKLETTLKSEIGEKVLVDVLQAKVAEFGLKSQDDGFKNPEIMTRVLVEAAAQKAMSKSLDQIVDRILALDGQPPSAAA